MIHPIPPGTRDVLPEEMRELRRIGDELRSTFDRFGYGEVTTPTMEYEDVLLRGDAGIAGASYRLFDEQGHVLALRSDMTIPIARLVATRYGAAEPPFRFSYLGRAYRAVQPHRGLQREFFQAGAELVGQRGPEGDAEVIEVLCAALEATGLREFRLGMGDAALYRRLLDALEVGAEVRQRLLEELLTRDYVGLEREVAAAGLDPHLAELPRLRGGAEVLDQAAALGGGGLAGPVRQAVESLRACHALLAERGRGDRIIFDLGLVHDLGYYSGVIYEIYDPALGFPLGGGGRYDTLVGRFGRDLPAAGFALYVERLHLALAGGAAPGREPA